MCNALSLSQKQVILGGLLGDSSMTKSGSVRFNHSIKQKDYLLWKYDMFINKSKSPIYERKYKEGYIGYSFSIHKKSIDCDLIRFIKKNLYTPTRKKISLKYLNELDSLGLAVWWMDDGSLSIHKGNRWGKICTHCFNFEENILIQKYFHNKWNIDVDIRNEKERYCFIRLNVKALKRLFRIIYKHVVEIPQMIYKIDLDYKKESSIGDFADVYFFIKNAKENNLFNGTLSTAGLMW